MEQQIKTAAKLYQCRDTCKRLWGSEWKSNVKKHMDLIRAEMLSSNIDNEVEAAIKLIEIANSKNIDGSGVFAIKCLAAAVEMIDPS